MEKQNCLLYCNCGAKIITDKKQNVLAESFQHLHIDVFELHDLCAFSLNEKEFINSLDSKYNKVFIVACYPRAIENMFLQNNIKLSNFEVLNFRELSEEEIVSWLKQETLDSNSIPNYKVLKSSLEVPAWYPVIDESLCTLCGQCARFCVFGVYKFKSKKLDVLNPLNCKNNCPACGRTCPASAIIFPRLPENAVLSGAQPGAEKSEYSPAKKPGLFVMLNERNSMRRSIFKEGIMQQAEEEKLKAINEYKKGLEEK